MKIYVAELIYPGSNLSLESKYYSRPNAQHPMSFSEAFAPFRTLLSSMERSLGEAAIALSYFESIDPLAAFRAVRQNRDAMLARLREIEQQLETVYKPANPYDYEEVERIRRKIRFEAELTYKREQWAQGVMPTSYHQQLRHMYAKVFLFALDRIKKMLECFKPELRKAQNEWTFLSPSEKTSIDKIVADIGNAKGKFKSSFSELSNLRDSSAHMEDRVRFLGKNGEIVLQQPAGPRVYDLESLEGNLFVSVSTNGTKSSVEVSEKSLLTARDCIQAVINAFEWDEWSGPSIRPL